MRTEELLRKLEALYGPEMKQLRYWYLAARPELRGLLDAHLTRLHDENVLNDEGILLSSPDASTAAGEYPLAHVRVGRHVLHPFGLREPEWIQHLAVFGRSGAGKTNLVCVILEQLLEHEKPFLVFDWKRNYRDFLINRRVQIFTVGRSIAPFRFNPWLPPPGTSTEAWIKKVIEVMAHAYFAGEGVIDVLLRSAEHARHATGTLRNTEVLRFAETILEKARQAQWKASALRILRSLEYGGMGDTTNCPDNQHLPALFESQVVLELDALGDADKTFLIEALMLWLHHYRLSRPERETFLHAVIIEEAHHILLRAPYDRGAENVMDMVLREIRELGEAVILVDQHPSMISLPALGNTNTTVCFNLKHQSDVQSAANALLLDHDERHFLGQLEVGSAIVKLQGRYKKPFQILVPKVHVPKGTVTDEQLRAQRVDGEEEVAQWVTVPGTTHRIKVPGHSQIRRKERRDLGDSAAKKGASAPQGAIRPVPGRDKSSWLGAGERAMLASLQEFPLLPTVERYRLLALSSYQGHRAKQALIRMGLACDLSITTRDGRVVLLQLTEQGRDLLGLPRESRPGLEHQYWVKHVAELLRKKGFTVRIEPSLDHHNPDLHATCKNEVLIAEIETGKSDIVANYRRLAAAKADRRYLLATSTETLQRLRRLLPDNKSIVLMLARDFLP